MKITYSSSKQYPITKTFTDEEGTPIVITGRAAVDRVNDYLTALDREHAPEMAATGDVTLHSDLDTLVIQMATALEALRTISELDGTGGAEEVARGALASLDE